MLLALKVPRACIPHEKKLRQPVRLTRSQTEHRSSDDEECDEGNIRSCIGSIVCVAYLPMLDSSSSSDINNNMITSLQSKKMKGKAKAMNCRQGGQKGKLILNPINLFLKCCSTKTPQPPILKLLPHVCFLVDRNR